jgi:hypothetical protein
MKTTILIKENRTQLVLHPESAHDKATLDILEKMPNTHRVNLYDRQGDFTMFDAPRYDSYGNQREIGKDLMIVFDQGNVAMGEDKDGSE